MEHDASKVTLHMVASLDGFIEKKDRSVSWMESSDHYDKGVTLTDEDVEAFIKTIDCYVMGSRTYELALELGWPYGEVPVFVLTHRNLSSERDNVEFFSGDLCHLVNDLLKPKYNTIWLVGGAMVAKEFIRLGLVDAINLTIVPILLGDGKLFFDFVGRELQLHLNDTTAYKNGMVELVYEVRKD